MVPKMIPKCNFHFQTYTNFQNGPEICPQICPSELRRGSQYRKHAFFTMLGNNLGTNLGTILVTILGTIFSFGIRLQSSYLSKCFSTHIPCCLKYRVADRSFGQMTV